MENIKVFLIALTIILLAANSLQSIAMAAQITGINKSKGRIHIDRGMDDGFIQGAEAYEAVVKVPPKEEKMIEIGTRAMLEVKNEVKEETKEKEDWFR